MQLTDFLCGKFDNYILFHLAHNFIICAISVIEIISETTHNLPMTDLARTPKQVGSILQRTRKKLGLSQTELGARAGLRQETISLIETGNPATKLETILAVLAALDLEFRIVQRTKSASSDIETIF